MTFGVGRHTMLIEKNEEKYRKIIITTTSFPVIVKETNQLSVPYADREIPTP